MAENFSIRLEAQGARQYIRDVGEANRISEALRRTLNSPISAKLSVDTRSAAAAFRDVERQAAGTRGALGQAGTSAASAFNQGITRGIGGIGGVISGALRPLNTIVTGFFLGLGNQASIAFTSAFRGIGNQIRTGIQEAANFSTQAVDIAAISIAGRGNISLAEQQQIIADTGKVLEDLAVDPKLVVDLNQAAAAALALQKTGTDLGAGDQGALRAAIELQNTVGATGSDSEFQTSAEIIGRAQKQYGLAADELGRITQTATGLLAFSPTKNLTDLSDGLNIASSAAAAYAIQIEETGATLASVSPYFSSLSEAGTAQRSFLNSLVNPTDGARCPQTVRHRGLQRQWRTQGSRRDPGYFSAKDEGSDRSAAWGVT
ncbi:MAG: phage tail tape measure protein [Caldilineaceae bacterium]